MIKNMTKNYMLMAIFVLSFGLTLFTTDLSPAQPRTHRVVKGDTLWDICETYAHQVGRKRSNAWGLYDMHGNAFEWCFDRYEEDYYADSPTDDPSGPTTGLFRVYRGGSVFCYSVHCRSATRQRETPDFRSSLLGFRVALVLAD